MPGDAFTAGVKLGGLTNGAEIRILLCYLLQTVGPLDRELLEQALMQEELVNYFELCAAIESLTDQQLAARGGDGRYAITPKGAEVADSLALDLPRTVREGAARAVIRLQAWARKSAQHHAEVQKMPDGFAVDCWIEEMGSEVLRLRLAMPDALTAEAAKHCFIENGSEVFRQLLDTLTDAPEG